MTIALLMFFRLVLIIQPYVISQCSGSWPTRHTPTLSKSQISISKAQRKKKTNSSHVYRHDLQENVKDLDPPEVKNQV